MKIVFLTVLWVIYLLVLLPLIASASDKGAVPQGTVSLGTDATVMFNRRTVICLNLDLIDKIMKDVHGEKRVFSAETNENGADGFLLFVGSDSWTAVELIHGRGCIVQSGKSWAGGIPGNSL